MKHFLFIILCFSISLQLFARCTGRYADGILNEFVTGCTETSISLAEMGEATNNAVRNVSLICDGGCYSALFNPDLRVDCNRRYAEVLRQALGPIRSYANTHRCSVDERILERYISGPNPSSASPTPSATQHQDGPLASCFWVYQTTVRGTTSCSNRVACVGRIYCTEGQYAHEHVELNCDALQDGTCPNLDACARAEDVNWLTIQSSRLGHGVRAEGRGGSVIRD